MTSMIRLAIVATCAASAAMAQEYVYYTSYRVTLNFGQPVTNILMYEGGLSFGRTTWAFTAGGSGETVLDNPFPSTEPILSSVLIGIVRDLPNDAPGQRHVVLMMDPLAAQYANHIAWGTLFRHTIEENIMDAIELATSGQDWPIVIPALEEIAQFLHGDGTDGILDPLAQPHSVWFDTGTSFVVMAWTDGQIIGEGVSETIEVPAGCVGDVNDDQVVDLTDLATLLVSFGVEEGAVFEEGDLDGDGAVGLSDLGILLAVYGQSC